MIRVIKELRLGNKLILSLDQPKPQKEYWKYRISGKEYQPIMVYDMGDAAIAVESEVSLVGKEVEFV